MKVSVKYDSLSEEARYALSKQLWLLGEAKRVVREASFGVERRVKEEMPKRTGRAAGSWGHWTPGDLIMDNPDAKPGDAVWDDTKDGGLTITQGSNVVYVEALNDGHSSQAPAGFLDSAEEAGVREIDNKLSALADEL